MALRVVPGYQQQLIQGMLTELAAEKEREQLGSARFKSDICDWAEHNFYIPNPEGPVILPLHQKAILRFGFTRDDTGHFPYQNFVYSTIKKSGKSTTGGIIARWFAETQGRYGEIFTIGNDLEQAKDRAFKEVMRSIEMTPGYNRSKELLPGRWDVLKLSMKCLPTGSAIKAISVDAAGEAGGQPALSVWTELWGFEDQEARRFWDEMTPIPTVPDSLRVVETYAGYEGESELLRSLYDLGLEGHQMSAGELAAAVCREDVPGEQFDDYVRCWWEARKNGEPDPEAKIPVWYNGRFFMYWDSGMLARRMPWQHMPTIGGEVAPRGTDGICEQCLMTIAQHYIGIPADEYYADQERIGPPQAYRRLHLNEWVGAESEFVPMEAWDQCNHVHEMPPLIDGDKTTVLILAADAAVTGDCFGIVAVTRCKEDPTCVDVRAVKKWDPRDTGTIDLSEPEDFLRKACSLYNVYQIAYDPFQLESTAQRLRKEGVAWMYSFTQAQDRLKADSQLYDMIISRRIHHNGEQFLREHISNANAKMQKDEDSKLRIVKKKSGKKIDLAVALSMAVNRCMYFRLEGL